MLTVKLKRVREKYVSYMVSCANTSIKTDKNNPHNPFRAKHKYVDVIFLSS